MTQSAIAAAEAFVKTHRIAHLALDRYHGRHGAYGDARLSFAVGGFVAMECATIFDHEHYIAAKDQIFALHSDKNGICILVLPTRRR
ncbi:Hypothetical protein PHPALM_14951 [Phytophthora palmivora]|uniref:Uncharacterized protein n=1 Tax=Phytophthora palmivora TaxID=4796 RepID=A0A2P4XTC5_9STRA|nr:Hypothetical protein PHPALM_14951 [Phytophthora palmivora]